jgi:hypothetical protein
VLHPKAAGAIEPDAVGPLSVRRIARASRHSLRQRKSIPHKLYTVLQVAPLRKEASGRRPGPHTEQKHFGHLLSLEKGKHPCCGNIAANRSGFAKLAPAGRDGVRRPNGPQ